MNLQPPFGVWAFSPDRLAVLCPGWPDNTIVADNVVSRDAARAIAMLPELLELHRFLALGPGDGDTRPLMEILADLSDLASVERWAKGTHVADNPLSPDVARAIDALPDLLELHLAAGFGAGRAIPEILKDLEVLL